MIVVAQTRSGHVCATRRFIRSGCLSIEEQCKRIDMNQGSVPLLEQHVETMLSADSVTAGSGLFSNLLPIPPGVHTQGMGENAGSVST
jgi:hypothetical protein